MNLSYQSLGIKKKTTPSMTAMSPINLINHGIRVADAERIKRMPNIKGIVKRIFRSTLLNILLTNFLVSVV